MNRVYIVSRGKYHNEGGGGDLDVVAMDEEGAYLAQSRAQDWDEAKRDLGVEGDGCHDKYAERYPDGFEVVLARTSKHPGVKRALRIRRRKEEDAPRPAFKTKTRFCLCEERPPTEVVLDLSDPCPECDHPWALHTRRTPRDARPRLAQSMVWSPCRKGVEAEDEA